VDIQYFEDGYLPVDLHGQNTFFCCVHESVKLAAKYGHAASSKYVNAVLRNIARNKENLPYPDRNNDTAHYLSVKYSHPVWMVKDWLDCLVRNLPKGF